MKVIAFNELTRAENRKVSTVVIPQLKKYSLIQSIGVSLNEENKDFCEQIESCIERLPARERTLIEKRYLGVDSDYLRDYQVCKDMFDPPISQRTYNTIKARAMLKLALMLNIDTGIQIKLT